LARGEIAKNSAFCYEIFPVLAERRRQLAGSMSGGQQQMLAIARALMSAPKLLLVDEPSVGLAPILVSHTITKIKELKERYGLTVLMAEQNFHQAIRIADRCYIILYLAKLIRYPAAVREEFVNPVQLGFCGALPVGMFLIGGGLAPYFFPLANLIWWLGYALLLAFQVWALSRWLSGSIDLAHINAG